MYSPPERGIRAPIIVLTATNTVNAAVEAMKRGASDFITKPFELDALRIKVRNYLEKSELVAEVERLRDEVEDRHSGRLAASPGSRGHRQERFQGTGNGPSVGAAMGTSTCEWVGMYRKYPVTKLLKS